MESISFGRDSRINRDQDVNVKQKWKSVSEMKAVIDDDSDDCFSCNICLDSPQDPVVTLCGHLYCWPCIYRWLQVKGSMPDGDVQQQQEELSCPVCKASISSSSALVPLYGRGTSGGDLDSKKASPGSVIPRRPTPTVNASVAIASNQSQPLRPNFFQSQPQAFHHQQLFSDPYGAAMASTNLGGAAMSQIFNPVIGMFGELIFARTLGISNTSLFAYSYPNSNAFIGSYSNTRMRRQEMQLEKSLNRTAFLVKANLVACKLIRLLH